MNRLDVLYDRECRLCRRCCRWLGRQPAYLELRFIPLQDPEVAQRFPSLGQLDPGDRLIVVSDKGDVYQGQHAWIICLYALRDYRAWSQKLAHPALLPFARQACELISKNRLALSSFLHEPPEQLSAQLQQMPPEVCRVEGACS